MNVKNLIVKKFIEIGNKDGFNNVTINKIVNECDISRTAFYYHFKDIPDVIDYYLHGKISNVMQECMKKGDMKKGIEYCTENLFFNFPEYKKMADSKWRTHAEICMYENWIDFAEKMFATNQKKIPITVEEKKFLINFITGGICHYVLYGNQQEMNGQIFAEQLYQLLAARFSDIKRKN